MIPAITRETSSTVIDSARPKMMYETADPNRPRISSGRRPCLSESDPQMGEKKNCIAE